MSEEIAHGLTVKIFVGCLLTSEIRMHLNQSRLWKQASIQPPSDTIKLVEVHHLGKDYLGYYLDTDATTIREIDEREQLLCGELQRFCPDFDISSVKPSVFTQVFVA